ncbi:MAG: VWA domain-containing protein, partial [Rhizobiales bacterium]|nr:VWA domain-containing protein [Rhizobacter sp.]
AQLRRRAHRIVWLNPLLRFDGFEPRAAGVRALLPNVDRFLPVHNLASLADLGKALRATSVAPSSLLA